MTMTYADALKAVIAEHDCEGQLADDLGTVVYCENPATTRAVGEQDSFGVEYLYFCEACANDFYDSLWEARAKEQAKRENEPCQRCKKLDPGKVWQRRSTWDESWEEPSWLCTACRKYDAQEEAEESCGYRAEDEDCFCGDEQHLAADADRKEWLTERAECAKRPARTKCTCHSTEHFDQDYEACSKESGPCWCEEHWVDDERLRGHDV